MKSAIQRLAQVGAIKGSAARYGALLGICILGLYGMPATQQNGPEWVDGYYLGFHPSGTTSVNLRYFANGQWQSASSVGSMGSGSSDGVGLAQSSNRATSLLGYSRGGDIYVHVGLGLIFDGSPGYDLKSTLFEGAPAIVNVGQSLWAVAFKHGDHAAIRPLRTQRGHTYDGFAPPILLDDKAIGRPALAHHNAKLVVLWQHRSTEHKFRTLAATVQPFAPSASFDLVDQAYGELPSGPSNYVPELAADPALAHDGVGTFYAAVLKRSGYTGLTHDALFVYSSSDGVNWQRVDFPGSPTLHTGQTNLSMAAWPNGDVLLALTTYESGGEVGKVFRYRNGSWTELDWWSVFNARPAMLDSFSLIRSSYSSQ